MSRSEVAIAVDWAAQEGWNPGLHDAHCYYTADPNGFLIGFLGDEPIATISAIQYGESFGFLGFYIVKPGYRGRGYGIQIWNAGLQQLEGRTIGLDGVADQQANYERSGFHLAYRNRRYQGAGSGSMPVNADIVQLNTLPFEMIEHYDQPFFPADRSPFLSTWIKQPNCEALGMIHNGRLVGYGVIRQCRSGHKIGPLFADNPEWAESLFLALKASVKPSGPIFLDTPDVNQAAVDMAERNGMTISFETARMFRGEVPDLPVDRLFGVTSFEVG